MLLGRAANGLYWMNRYIERAENMARLVDAGLRMALTRTAGRRRGMEVGGAFSAGAEHALRREIQRVHRRRPCRISCCATRRTRRACMSSIETARINARMVRTALTRETWESINEAWMSLKRMLATPIDERELPERARRDQARDGADPRLLSTARCCATRSSTSPRSAPSSSAPTTPRAFSTSNITCCCRRSPGSARRSTITSGN